MTFLRKPMNGADFCFPKERTFYVLSKMIWGYLLQVLLDFLKNVHEKKGRKRHEESVEGD